MEAGGVSGKNVGAPMSDVCIVVDSGFSFTHVLPFYQGRALHKSVSRCILCSFSFPLCFLIVESWAKNRVQARSIWRNGSGGERVFWCTNAVTSLV